MYYKKYRNPELGFELQYPGGWIVDEDPGFPAIIFISMHEQSEMMYNENVSCFVEQYSDGPGNFKNDLKNLTKILEIFVQNFEIIEEIEKIEFLGDSTYRIKAMGNQENFNVIILSYWILWDTKVYIVNLIVEKSQFNEKLSIFETMLTTFKIFSPEPLTQEIEMQRKKNRMLASIDFVQVEHNINTLSSRTNIQKISDLIDVFSFASMMDNLMGFGSLNYLYPKFYDKLEKTELLKILPEDIISTINKFNEFAKKKNLI